MNKEIVKRLGNVEAAIKAANTGGTFCIKITNTSVDTTHIIAPGKCKKTIKEYDTPLEAVHAVEDFMLRRRLHTYPICRFDNILALYPEVSGSFEEYAPIKALLSPYYGRDNISIYQFELRHIILYRHVAAIVYGTDQNAYAVGEHPAQIWFESIMDIEIAAKSQVALLEILYTHCLGNLPKLIKGMGEVMNA